MKVFVGAGVGVAVGVCVGFGVRVILGVLVRAAKRGVVQPVKPRMVTMMQENLMTLFNTHPLGWRTMKGRDYAYGENTLAPHVICVGTSCR